MIDEQCDVSVFGGSLVEQVIQIPRLPRENQDNVPLNDMRILPGGSGGNVAVYISRLGGLSRLIDKWGCDKHGDFLEEKLALENVDLSFCKRSDDINTSFMIILTLPNYDWSGITRISNNSNLFKEDIDIEGITNCKYIHFHGFFFDSEASIAGVKTAIKNASKRGVKVSLDTCTPIATYHPELIRALLNSCSILFANEYEAGAITKEENVSKMADFVLDKGVDYVVIKLGAKGCFIASKYGKMSLPSFDVQIVDTVGAGDAVVAGTLFGLCNDLGFTEAVKLGMGTAALVCQGIGAQSNLFSLRDVEMLVG